MLFGILLCIYPNELNCSFDPVVKFISLSASQITLLVFEKNKADFTGDLVWKEETYIPNPSQLEFLLPLSTSPLLRPSGTYTDPKCFSLHYEDQFIY